MTFRQLFFSPEGQAMFMWHYVIDITSLIQLSILKWIESVFYISSI